MAWSIAVGTVRAVLRDVEEDLLAFDDAQTDLATAIDEAVSAVGPLDATARALQSFGLDPMLITLQAGRLHGEGAVMNTRNAVTAYEQGQREMVLEYQRDIGLEFPEQGRD